MPKDDARAFDYVMSFVAGSRRYKDQFVDRWREVLANFIVDPEEYANDSVSRPYGKGQNRGGLYGSRGNRGVVLKDAETHKAIMTYASRLVLTVLGDRKGEYIHAAPVGWEDSETKGPTVTKLMRYAFSIPGHFRTMVEAVVDMLLFGTSIVEINWKYQEREQPVRSVGSVDGVITSDFTRQNVVAYDDPLLSVVDNQDFFPDPSNYRIENMVGVAKKFKMTAMAAEQLAEAEIYSASAVQQSINHLGQTDVEGDRPSDRSEKFREGLDQPYHTDQVDEFTEMIGIEYWGEVPWADDKGSSRRVITILEGVVVRDDPYPLADADLPFRSLVINPVVGRFYGISPAEVIRYDQSLQDAVKILLAEAVIRSVHPPIAYDIDSDIDLNLLRRWSPDLPIGIRGGPNSIGTLRYDANVFNGFSLAQANKVDMQEASGATSVLQGQGLNNARSSATEAGFANQQAQSRPELAAVLLEKDAMPGIAKSILRRYQQFLEDDDDLRLRVGERPESVWIGDIMGDFDVNFVGSRLAQSRQEKLQAYDRLAAITVGLPQAGMLVPWMDFLTNFIGDTLELPEVAAKMGNPDTVKLNAVLSQLAQQGQGAGNGNGTTPAAAPAGQLPAQAGGGSVG